MARFRWNREGLKAEGFVGWHPFADLQGHLGEIPTSAGGVYVIYRTATERPKFLPKSPGGTWRGDPTESIPALDAKWVDGTNVVYIGKANNRQLRTRLRAYLSFGNGGSGRHFGGRYIWQLPDSMECLVAWRITSEEEVPRAIEAKMISDFQEVYGARPLANLIA